jgi:hypothetical protein
VVLTATKLMQYSTKLRGCKIAGAETDVCVKYCTMSSSALPGGSDPFCHRLLLSPQESNMIAMPDLHPSLTVATMFDGPLGQPGHDIILPRGNMVPVPCIQTMQ